MALEVNYPKWDSKGAFDTSALQTTQAELAALEPPGRRWGPRAE